MMKTIRNQDQYGHPVTFNFNGNETYQTVPGGIISIVFVIVVLAYGVLKLKYMVQIEEWELK